MRLKWSVMLLALLSARAFAQTNLGRIVGIVRDTSGAAIAGAAIQVSNEGTGWTREFQSQETGDYEVANLVPGIYTVQAERAGFRRFVQSNIVLDASRTIRVDVQLELGELAQEIRVTAASATVVETESPAIINRIDYELQIKSPVGTGNRPWELLAVIPTLQSGAAVFVYSIAGNRGAQNEFHLDGIASVGSDSPLGSTSMTTGATVELKVQAASNSAEYSQSGIYQQISRSGTNDFHGEVRYFHANSVLNARGYFAATKPSSRNHQFGLWAGGPVKIPGLYNGRDRTFFMLAYEGGRTPGASEANATVPTAAMRAGDFAGVATIRDPLTGQPFAGNRIPADRISPVSARLQDRFYPLPNFGNTAAFAALNHRILFIAPGKFDHADARFDQKISNKNTLYGRMGYQQFPVRQLQSNLPAIGELARLREFWNPVLSDTHVFSPTLVNEFRIGGTRSNDPQRGPQRGLEVLQTAGILGIQNVPDAAGMPQITIAGLQPLTQAAQSQAVDQQWQMNDAITWIRGRHSFKTGLDLRRAFPNRTVVPLGTYGSFNFTNAFTGHAYSDFLLGLPQESSRNYPAPSEYRRQWQWGFFFQDDFKVNRRLTLQLGLRYEYQTPTTHLNDAFYNFDSETGGLVLVSEDSRKLLNPLFNPRIPITVADGNRLPKDTLWRSDKNNFAPRIGFAFRPTASNTFAIRGGYFVFYDAIGYGLSGSSLAGPFTPGVERFTNSITGGVPLFQFPRPFPETTVGASTALPSVNGVIPWLRNPYVQQWNLTIEKEHFNTGFRASYMGLKGTQLLVQRNINKPLPSATPFNQNRRPYPLYVDILLADQGGNNNYHALQLEATRRTTDLLYGIAYTWSNTISDAADSGGEVAAQMENPYNRAAERGRESYALQHRFTSYAIWRIPVGTGRRFLSSTSGPANAVLGGWELIGNLYLQSGPWFTPSFTGSDPSNTNTIGGRPDRIADGNISDPTPDRWFDVSAFAVPPANSGRFGNSGRNILEGPPTKVVHLTLSKVFSLHEKVKLNLMLTGRNLFNTPNFNPPNANISTPVQVGRITATQGDLLAGNPRQIQVRTLISW